MDDSVNAVIRYFQQLTPKNQMRILSHIILLIEAQKQCIEWPDFKS